MGSQISVPLGSYVLGYSATNHTYGDIVTGDLLYASYVPGSYPYGYSFTPAHKFECHGVGPVRCTMLWQRVA